MRRLALVVAVLTMAVVPASTAWCARFVYVTNSRGGVSEYDGGASGLLVPLSPATVGTRDTPLGVKVSPDGRSAYVANIGSDDSHLAVRRRPRRRARGQGPAHGRRRERPRAGRRQPGWRQRLRHQRGRRHPLSQYDVGPGGALTPKSPATVATGSEPIGVAVTPDGRSVYVTDLGLVAPGSVSQYDVGAGGALAPKSPATVAAGLNPEGIAVSPDGRSAYVTNINSSDISQYDVGAGGRLSPKRPGHGRHRGLRGGGGRQPGRRQRLRHEPRGQQDLPVRRGRRRDPRTEEPGHGGRGRQPARAGRELGRQERLRRQQRQRLGLPVQRRGGRGIEPQEPTHGRRRHRPVQRGGEPRTTSGPHREGSVPRRWLEAVWLPEPGPVRGVRRAGARSTSRSLARPHVACAGPCARPQTGPPRRPRPLERRSVTPQCGGDDRWAPGELRALPRTPRPPRARGLRQRWRTSPRRRCRCRPASSSNGSASPATGSRTRATRCSSTRTSSRVPLRECCGARRALPDPDARPRVLRRDRGRRRASSSGTRTSTTRSTSPRSPGAGHARVRLGLAGAADGGCTGSAERAVEVEPHRPYELGPFTVTLRPEPALQAAARPTRCPFDGELSCEHLDALSPRAYRAGRSTASTSRSPARRFYHQGSANLIDDEVRRGASTCSSPGSPGAASPGTTGRASCGGWSPAVVVASHYDDFFRPLVGADGLLDQRATSPRFPTRSTPVSRDIAVAALEPMRATAAPA